LHVFYWKFNGTEIFLKIWDGNQKYSSARCFYQQSRKASFGAKNIFRDQYLSRRALCIASWNITRRKPVILPTELFALHKQKHARTHASVFQRLIRLGVLVLNLEIALELSAESARVRESFWYKLFLYVSFALDTMDDRAHIGGSGYILSFLIISHRYTRKTREEEDRQLICTHLKGCCSSIFARFSISATRDEDKRIILR